MEFFGSLLLHFPEIGPNLNDARNGGSQGVWRMLNPQGLLQTCVLPAF